MMEERKRASALDLSGFAPRATPAEAPDPKALASVIEETPFKSRTVAPISPAADEGEKRGRKSRGEKGNIFARIPVEHVDRLNRIRDDKGWSLVTALERAIDALGRQEGID